MAGDPSDLERFRQALLEQPIKTVIGPMRFDPRNNQAVLDIHVNELVAGSDGQPLNTAVHNFPAVQDPGPAG